MNALLVTGIALCLAIVAYALLAGRSARKASQRRLQVVRLRHSEATTDKVEAQYRRAIAARKPRVPNMVGSSARLQALAVRLNRTGRGWTVQRYIAVSVGLMLLVAVAVLLHIGSLLLAAVAGAVVGAGVPHVVVNSLVSRRQNAFTVRFPDAIELLVRGLRSGLPISETLGIVSGEIPGPIGEEFKLVTERMRIGRTMEEALQDTADRLDTPEFSFFVIAIAIQRETGGNLAETLANLADVLRKRAQMKLKIRAMSSESKASAYIVGALPFIVFIMIWWINPEYVGAFFTDTRLTIVGVGGLVWMGIGAFTMAKMVSFEI